MNAKRMLLSACVRAVLACAVVFLSLTIQTNAQQSTQVLHGHVPVAVSNGKAELVGALPADQKMHVTISLPLRNQTALNDLLKRLYDPKSSDYRHFLTVAQFTDQFAPTVADYQAVVNFATAHGLTVTDQPKNRLIVPLDGAAQQIENAFNLKMNFYKHPTENRNFYAPDREPSLALSVSIAHVTGLDNFVLPHPLVKKASAQAAANGSGPNGSYLASDMRAAYYGGSALTGSGQTVGLFEFDGYDLSDVNLTFSSVGQSYSVPIQNVLLDNATGAPCQFQSPCSDGEEVLDIVQAIGMAPGLSQVRVYIGSNDTDILREIAYEDIAKQVSISWVWGDNTDGDDIIFYEMAGQGQSVLAASGDWGSYPAIYPAFPAEDQYVTGVGGTSLVTNGAGGTWLSETAWSDSGGGPSPDGIPIPSYQSALNGANGASTTLRNIPDVAAEADFDNWACDLGSCSGTWAGTSFAAPRWAGFVALANQQYANSGYTTTLGNLNLHIYPIAQSVNYSNDFHDIITGSNGVYPAGTGYDLVTGWGSPNGQNLINDLVELSIPPFRPNSYNCSGNVTNPQGPTQLNGGDASLVSVGGRSNTVARCTYSAFAKSSYLTTVPMTISFYAYAYRGAAGTVSIEASYGTEISNNYSGTYTATIPVGTDLSTISVTGSARASSTSGDEAEVDLGPMTIQ